MKKTDLLITFGKTCMANGNYNRALETFETILAESPRNIEALQLAAEINETNGHFELAAEWMRKAIPCATSPRQMLHMQQKLGALYIAANQHFKAIKVFQAVDELSKSVSNAVEDTAAPTIAPKAETGSDDNPHVWNELGLVLYKVGAYDDAIDAYQNALKIDNCLPFVHSNLAQAYLNLGKLEETLVELETLLSLQQAGEPTAEIWERIRVVYRLQNETEKAAIVDQILGEMKNAVRKNESRFANLPLNQIRAGEVSNANLDELVRSIRLHGILQPLIVTPAAEPDTFTVVAGNRRYAAAKIAGLEELPVIIRNLTEAESIEISLHENMHNEIKDSQSLTNGLQKLAVDHDYSIDELANRLGVSTFSVANSLKAPGMAAKRQATDSGGTLEKDFIKNMMRQLGADVEVVVEKEETVSSIEPLWYMQSQAVVPAEQAISVEHNSLFQRAAKMLSQNPHPTRLWL